MPTFVHLAPESSVALIRRVGIGRLRKPFGPTPGGIFAVPVTRNFYLSHQWLRELKRRSGATICGVYFRIPDDEPVWLGHYGAAHQQMTAVEAARVFSSSTESEGWQVIIPRRILPKEIQRVRVLPQVVGWRFYPKSKGEAPRCVCKFCTRGEFGAVRLRERLGPPE